MAALLRIGAGFYLLFFIALCWGQIDVPQLSRRVTDLTATLTSDQINTLEQKLAAFEAEKGSQVAVLIVATTQPEAIEQFGIRVADAWKIGRTKIDDGVILIIAKNDRKLRLEVGYGLEGAIPDAIARRVISETITPFFKRGDFAGGIDAGVTQLFSIIRGEVLPPAETGTSAQAHEGYFMFILVAGIFAGAILSALFGRVAGALMASLGSAAMAFVFLGIGFALIIGLIVFIFLIGGFNSRGGGWSSGGHYRGSGGGGSWSGGGGGFGGGGASGSW